MAYISRFTTLLLLVSMSIVPVFAQQDTPAPQADAEATEETPPDQEVEVNEDNYRQFMELKDDLRQRTVIPEESFASRSGLQKLDKLPEESQKHLRNELREIISSGDRWQPGDENADYPYVPSEAAQGNVGLQQQEAEAWGELLDNYHAREAQIYANSARSRAAAAASGAMPGQAGESTGDGQGSQNQAAQQGQKQGSQTGSAGDNFAPSSQHAEGEQSAEGVAQNAMEFLQKAGYQEGNTKGKSAQQAGNQQDGSGETGSQQTQAGGESSAADEQQDTAMAEAQDVTIEVTKSESDEPADEGVSQNALEYLAGEGAATGEASQDTLSIEDLLNASGVSTGVSAAQEEPEEPSDEPPKDPPD